MKVRVVYNTHQLRQVTQHTSEEIELSEPALLRSLLKQLEQKYGGSFASSLYESKGSRLENAVLCDGHGARDLDQPLRERSVINFVMLATSG